MVGELDEGSHSAHVGGEEQVRHRPDPEALAQLHDVVWGEAGTGTVREHHLADPGGPAPRDLEGDEAAVAQPAEIEVPRDTLHHRGRLPFEHAPDTRWAALAEAEQGRGHHPSDLGESRELGSPLPHHWDTEARDQQQRATGAALPDVYVADVSLSVPGSAGAPAQATGVELRGAE